MLLQAACHSRECLIANSGSFYTTDPGSILDQPDVIKVEQNLLNGHSLGWCCQNGEIKTG